MRARTLRPPGGCFVLGHHKYVHDTHRQGEELEDDTSLRGQFPPTSYCRDSDLAIEGSWYRSEILLEDLKGKKVAAMTHQGSRFKARRLNYQ